MTSLKFLSSAALIAATFSTGLLIEATHGAHAATMTPLQRDEGIDHRVLLNSTSKPVVAAPAAAAAPVTTPPAAAAATPATTTSKTATTTLSTHYHLAPAPTPNYNNPQTLIDGFKKTPPTASYCEPHAGAGCWQKYGVPDGKGGQTYIDLQFSSLGIHGQISGRSKDDLDNALAAAEKVYLSRTAGNKAGAKTLNPNEQRRMN
jgi:hypothetical protein